MKVCPIRRKTPYAFLRICLVLVAMVTIVLVSVTWSVKIQDLRTYHNRAIQAAASQFDMRYQMVTGSEYGHTYQGKHMHVAFLKVHKTGSTTAQNIFLRFGWEHNLTFLLPHAHNPSKYPNIISLQESLTSKNTLDPPSGRHYEMLVNHVIYNSQSFRRYMPNDTFYVGILREPFGHFKSILNYLRPRYIYSKIKTPIPASDYLKNPPLYEPKNVMSSFTNNRMAIEFGCPADTIQARDYNKTHAFIMQLDADFGLVIIAEHFDESIVLLRRYLDWSTKDILYIDKNIARHKNDTQLVGTFDRTMYRRWAKIDYALYSHFYKRLQLQIRAEGADFATELLHYTELREMTTEFCFGKGPYNTRVLVIEPSKWSPAFNITNDDCVLLRKQEMPFVQAVRFRQYGSYDI